MRFVLFGPFHIIVPDELQILNDLVEIVFTIAGPFVHEWRVKDISQFGLIDDDSLWLFGCGGFLFNGKRLLLDYRDFSGRL